MEGSNTSPLSHFHEFNLVMDIGSVVAPPFRSVKVKEYIMYSCIWMSTEDRR